MTWQEIVVGIIVLACLVEVVRRMIRFFRSAKNNENPCVNCATGCDLKRMLDEKQQQCKSEQKPSDKKCCG